MQLSPQMRKSILLTLAGLLLGSLQPLANAQRGGGHFAAAGAHGFRFGPGFGPGSNFQPNFATRSFSNLASRYGSLAYLAAPFWANDLYNNDLYNADLYNAGYPVAAPLPVIIVQGTSAGPAATMSETSSAPVQPLMIELQGDRYVRVSGDDRSGAEMVDREAVLSRRQDSHTLRTVQELPPAVLVFRDGHREEVSGYTITDGVLYASGDFYRDGSWNRKIELSSLSLPETVKASRERGVEFRLPTAPNEVIVRP
jgi:hypothetical protein